MFDLDFGKLVVCALIALVVLGPERLPKLARWLGRFTGQARTYMQGLSAELERESHLAELKRQLAETERLAREHADAINRSVMNTHQDLAAPVMTALAAPVPPPATTEPLAVEPEPAMATTVTTAAAQEPAPAPAPAPRVPLGKQPDLWLAEQARTQAEPTVDPTTTTTTTPPPAAS